MKESEKAYEPQIEKRIAELTAEAQVKQQNLTQYQQLVNQTMLELSGLVRTIYELQTLLKTAGQPAQSNASSTRPTETG